jgi:hypothetical protein
VKRLLWLFFGGISLIVLAGVVLAFRVPKQVVPTPLKLPNGEILRVLAVTYGTNHMVGSPVARVVARMPPVPQALLTRILGSRVALQCSATTSDPKLLVWLRRATNNSSAAMNAGYLTAVFSDTNGFLSGELAFIHDWYSNPQDLQFRVFPRREPLLTLNFFYHTPTGGVSQCGSLRFGNPVQARFPQWLPQPLPATQRTGDVAVTLEKLSTGHNQNTGYRSSRGGGRVIDFGTNRLDDRNTTVCSLRIHPLTNPNEIWAVASEEVSDATGNQAANTSLGWGSYEEEYFTFEPGLWPSETAWKLRCEIKRVEGFGPDETFVFRNVPLDRLDETNRIRWTTNFAGVAVTLEHILRRAPNTNNSWSSRDASDVQFTTVGLTNDLHLDLLSVRSDTGAQLKSGSWSRGGSSRNYTFRDIPLEANALDFVFAVQHGRWVEFTVKPEVGPLQLESRIKAKR